VGGVDVDVDMVVDLDGDGNVEVAGNRCRGWSAPLHST
jgi:hypothetical protein